MPPKSKAQRRFAGMSSTAKGRRKLRQSGKEPMPKDVAKDYRKKPKNKGKK